MTALRRERWTALRRWLDRGLVAAWLWVWWVRLMWPTYQVWDAANRTGTQPDFPTTMVLQVLVLALGVACTKAVSAVLSMVIDARIDRLHRRHALHAIEQAARRASVGQRGGR